ncbi:acyltransferase [Isoptericola hypogeus]|uniref:Acyltransferase n=1 Tax=Isoptericola hypogeus TaxID=300179 RepID=A0ABP4VQT4_9MICO
MASSVRLPWIDAGRGIAICLVVLYHAARWLDASGWERVNEYVTTLRMPFFFVLSGLLAVRVTTMAWSELWSRRLSLYLWVFVVWEVVGALAYVVGFAIRGTPIGPLGLARDVLVAPLMPVYELWFIWVLAVFCVVARLLRPVPRWIQLLAAAVCSVVALAPGFDLGNLGWNGALRYFVFFLAGMYGRAWLIGWVESSRGWRAASVAVWIGGVVAVQVLGLGGVIGGRFALSVLGVFAGLSLSSFLARWSSLRRLGANTLPVYVGHTPVIIVVSTTLLATLPAETVAGWNLLLCPALGALAIAVSQLAYRRSAPTLLAYLYKAPPFMVSLGSRRWAPMSRS